MTEKYFSRNISLGERYREDENRVSPFSSIFHDSSMRNSIIVTQRTIRDKNHPLYYRLPLKRVFFFEPDEHRTYTQAHKAGHEGKDCAAMFPECSFSLIDLALGKYNAPPSAPSPADPAAETFGMEDESAMDWTRYSMK